MRFLFVDKIIEFSPEKAVRGLKHVTDKDYYLCHDEQGRVCFIPSLVGETLGQLAAWNVMYANDFTKRPVAGVVASAHLYRPALIGETIFFDAEIDALDESAVRYHGKASVDDEVIFEIDGALGPLLPMADFIDTDIIRQQFAEIYQPDAKVLATLANKTNLQALNLLEFQFDRIVDFVPGKSLAAEKRITPKAPYLKDHFPNKPVLPMTVLLECKLNLAREFLACSELAGQYQIFEMQRIKMNEFVVPGDLLHCRMQVKSQDEKKLVLSYRSEVNGKRVCVLDVVLIAKGVS